jgi:Tfp pilus assembly protein PilV
MKRQRGVTLVELVTSIVVIAMAGAALLAVLGMLNSSGGTAMAQQQAQAVANAYLSEAMSKPWVDPNGADGETLRNQFDDLDDYDGLNESARDQAGNAAGNLQVRMSVLPAALGALPAADVRRVDVQVNYATGRMVIASGYRTRHP